MAGGADLTAIRSQLREHYKGTTPVEVFYKSSKDINPLMAAMDAVGDNGEGFGRKLIYPIIYGMGDAVGADFAKVQAKAQGSTTGAKGDYTRWEIDPVVQEAMARWSRDAMDAAQGKGSGETFKVMTTEMDLRIEGIRKRLAMYAWGTGDGVLATITAVSTTGFTVSTAVVNRFHRGQDLTASTTATGATKNSNASLLVNGVDYDTGVVTTSTDPTDTTGGRTAWAVGDEVFLYRDRPAGALSTYADYTLPWGIEQWLAGPSVTDGTGFCGVIRDDISELAGLTFNCANKEPEAAFRGALRMLFNTGGTKADALICNPEDYDAFIIQKDKSKTVQISLGKYELGFDGFTVKSLAGDVPVIPDAFCPSGTFIAGPFKDEKLAPKLVYLSELVNIDNRDGQDFVRSATSTDYEMRLYFRGNIVCPAPGKFVRGYGLTVS